MNETSPDRKNAAANVVNKLTAKASMKIALMSDQNHNEERPASLDQVYLAEFAWWYANANDVVDEEYDVPVDDVEDSEGVPEARTLRAPKEYRRRLTGRIIPYRRSEFPLLMKCQRVLI